jgi:uncharacterized protein
VHLPGQYEPYILYRCIVGSRAYGLDTPESDTDRRGFYLPPARLHWSLNGVPEQLENDATQECYWELQKLLTLALKCNPTVLECLFTPLVEFVHPLAQELLDMRSMFLSRLAYTTYSGYVRSQFKRIEADVRTTGEVRWKHAMHLIRLLHAGVGVMRDGVLTLRVDAEVRERLMSIRRGEMPWAAIEAWRADLNGQLDAAYATTRLAEHPNFERANAYLIKARRFAVSGIEG